MNKTLELHDVVSKYKELAKELGKQPTSREFFKLISARQITKLGGFNSIVKAAGFIPIEPKGMNRTPLGIEAPRILYFDIEVSFMHVKTYQLAGNDYISPKKIIRDWFLYSYAGIFEGEEDKPYYLDNRYSSKLEDDRQLIEGLHDLLSKADIICGHNNKRFDLKKFNARAVKWGLDPLPPKIVYDTLTMAKKTFSFTSNSLDYIANYLELKERKSGHSKFPGDMLWDEIEKGNIEAWDECQLYNIQDCRVTQELFKRLAAYDPQINIQAFFQSRKCICGSINFRKDGFKHTKSGKFQIRRCSSCGKVYTEKQNLIEKDLRKMLFQ